MNSERKDRQNYEQGLTVHPETEYLITDLQELINDKVGEFLGDEPFRIKANGYRPELLHGEKPIGIDLLEADYLMNIGSFNREFKSIDLLFNFPLKSIKSDNPINIEVKWSDGIQCRLAIVNNMSILLIEESENDGQILHSEQLPQEKMELYLESLGLPSSIWGSDIKELTRDLYNCPEFFMTQKAEAIVDLYTRIEVTHDAQLRHDIDDEKQLVQELTINLDHLSEDPPSVAPNELHLRPYYQFRNLLRFDRDESNSAWEYRGAYSGKLGTGELIDETVQLDPQLVIPNVKVLAKALDGLNL